MIALIIAGQLQKKRAATAAAWATTRKVPVPQLMFRLCRAGKTSLRVSLFIRIVSAQISFGSLERDSNSATECCPCKLANSTRPLASTRVTSKVRSNVSRPGITSARNVSHIPNEGLGPVAESFLRARRVLRMSMNESPHTVREQNIHFLWFDERRYFALAKGRMHQGLSFAISSRPIVRSTGLGGSSPSCAFLIWNP